MDGGLVYLKAHPQKRHQFNSVMIAFHRGQKIKNDSGVLCFKKLALIKRSWSLLFAEMESQIGKNLPVKRYRIIIEHGRR